MHIDDIQIDPELESLLPALPDDTREALKNRIIADGRIKDEVTVWQETKFLLDGHNRIRIYREESERHMIGQPTVKLMSFASRIDAMTWMIESQDERRNWTENDKKYALGKLYNETKKPTGRPVEDAKTIEIPEENNVPTSGDIIDATPKSTERTVEKLAKKKGVSKNTVSRAGRYATALDKIRTVNAKAADDIKSKSLKLSEKEVVALADSGDIATGLKNLRAFGDWRGKPEEPEPPPAKPGVDPAVVKRVMALEKSYEVILGHVSWLSTQSKSASTRTILSEMDTALTSKVFSGIQRLKKAVS